MSATPRGRLVPEPEPPASSVPLPREESVQRPVVASPGIAAILGASGAVRELRRDVLAIARSAAETVLVQGESGTGKDLVARAIHSESARGRAELVALNCSALSDGLLEAELQGYEAGAFTDAKRRKRGLLEVAHGGTLFLDEVAELPLALQARFLRLLEDRTFRRVGGTERVQVDVRVVAATNADLEALVRAGRFRADLYWRLAAVSVTAPPLRERREDVPLLARHFLAHYGRKFHKRFEGFEPAALERLCAHAWSGNVRELTNAIERVVLLRDGPLVRAADLLLAPTDLRSPLARPESADRGPAEPAERGRAASGGRGDDDGTARGGGSARGGRGTARSALPDASVGGEGGAGEPDPNELSVERVELATIVRALERAGGNRSEAARLLGVSRDTVRCWMERYGVRIETRVHVDRPPGP